MRKISAMFYVVAFLYVIRASWRGWFQMLFTGYQEVCCLECAPIYFSLNSIHVHFSGIIAMSFCKQTAKKTRIHGRISTFFMHPFLVLSMLSSSDIGSKFFGEEEQQQQFSCSFHAVNIVSSFNFTFLTRFSHFFLLAIIFASVFFTFSSSLHDRAPSTSRVFSHCCCFIVVLCTYDWRQTCGRIHEAILNISFWHLLHLHAKVMNFAFLRITNDTHTCRDPYNYVNHS